jgi:hypothetical protein
MYLSLEVLAKTDIPLPWRKQIITIILLKFKIYNKVFTIIEVYVKAVYSAPEWTFHGPLLNVH